MLYKVNGRYPNDANFRHFHYFEYVFLYLCDYSMNFILVSQKPSKKWIISTIFNSWIITWFEFKLVFIQSVLLCNYFLHSKLFYTNSRFSNDQLKFYKLHLHHRRQPRSEWKYQRLTAICTFSAMADPNNIRFAFINLSRIIVSALQLEFNIYFLTLS